MRSKRIALISCAGALALVALAGASYFWWIHPGYDPLPFSREGWAAASEEQRGYMVRDLLRRKLLDNSSKSAVVEILGRPDAEFASQAEYRVGYMGFNGNAPMVFSYRLILHFDSESRVEAVGVDD